MTNDSDILSLINPNKYFGWLWYWRLGTNQTGMLDFQNKLLFSCFWTCLLSKHNQAVLSLKQVQGITYYNQKSTFCFTQNCCLFICIWCFQKFNTFLYYLSKFYQYKKTLKFSPKTSAAWVSAVLLSAH